MYRVTGRVFDDGDVLGQTVSAAAVLVLKVEENKIAAPGRIVRVFPAALLPEPFHSAVGTACKVGYDALRNSGAAGTPDILAHQLTNMAHHGCPSMPYHFPYFV